MCQKITRTVIESLTSSFSTCSWHALRRASACLEKETITHQGKTDSHFAKSTTKHNMTAKDEPLVTWRAFEDRSSRNSFCRKYPKFFGSHRAPWIKRIQWKKLKYESQMGYSNIYYWPNDFFQRDQANCCGGFLQFLSYFPQTLVGYLSKNNSGKRCCHDINTRQRPSSVMLSSREVFSTG